MGYIYKITNTVNGKAYIGISIHNPEKGRIREHLTGRGNRILANAVKKYGRDAFTYEILEENVSSELLPDLEVAYIAKFETVAPFGYNLTTGGEIGKTPSEETLQKMSEAKKGENNPNYGKTHPEKTRRKISEALSGENNPNSGKPHSEEHCRKISEAHTGKKMPPFSEEHCQKLSKALSGENNPMFGKTHSEETLQKMSEAKKGENNPNYGKPSPKGMLGKRHTEESCQKMSEAHRSSCYKTAHQFFFSLPSDMDLKQKRRLLLEKFSDDVSISTIYEWSQKWNSEMESKT